MAAAGETRSTCPYCGVGCGVRISHEDGRITGVAGDAEHPATHGRLCSKGLSLPLTLSTSTRLLVRRVHVGARPDGCCRR